MKARPIIILMLFAASIVILAWLFYATTHSKHKEKASPWRETIADLNECSRAKHVKSAQYNHFATIADQESEWPAARLFRAMALSAGIQEHNCVKALNRLGGTYTPPTKVVVFNGTTPNNLARSIAYEWQRQKDLQGAQIDRAMNANNRYAARVLIWADAGDLRHIFFMEQCAHEPRQLDSVSYAVCPVCGNMYENTYCDHYCPFCLTCQSDFVWFD